MDTFFQDLRFGLRMLRKSPGFTAVAVLTLALGIGANTAIFTVINSVLLRPLPYPHSERILLLTETHKGSPGMSVAYSNFLDWQAQNHVFEYLGAVQPQSFVLTGSEKPELLPGRNISAGFFPALGVKPVLGREIQPSDDQPSAAPVALISYALWQRRFGGNPAVIGSSITLDQKNYTVIGVLPQDFSYRGRVNDIFVPIGLLANDVGFRQRDNHPGIYVIARLKPDVTLDRAQADLSVITRRLEQLYPASNKNNGVSMRTLYEVSVGDARSSLLILFAAVGFVLLIACANVANLLLARATVREREFAIRTALGAERFRLVRQMLTESVLLAVAGGALGLLIANLGVTILVHAAPNGLPRLNEISVDPTVLLFAFAASLLTGLTFGLVPALQISRFGQSLKENRTVTSGSHRLRSALIVSEFALSLVLLVGAGLLIRSFMKLLSVDPGFDQHNLLTVRIHLPETKYKTISQVDSFFDELLRRLQASPGVISAAANTPLPFSGNEWDSGFTIEGRPAPAAGEAPSTYMHFISPEYLQTMKIPLLNGRNFSYADNDSAPAVALVNRTFAEHEWPNENPIGKRVRLGGVADLTSSDEKKNPWITVVGVIGDVKQYGLDTRQYAQDSPHQREAFAPFNQHRGRPNSISTRSLVIRGDNQPLSLVEQVRRVVQEIDAEQPLTGIQTMDQLIADSVSDRRTSMSLLLSFALLALVLASIGIYGVISYWVNQRTREIGIRIALGAQPADMLQMVIGEGGRLTVIGVAIGLALTFVLTRAISRMLFGVRPTDPITLLGITAILAGVALLASYLPARRAARIDPMAALREE